MRAERFEHFLSLSICSCSSCSCSPLPSLLWHPPLSSSFLNTLLLRSSGCVTLIRKWHVLELSPATDARNNGTYGTQSNRNLIGFTRRNGQETSSSRRTRSRICNFLGRFVGLEGWRSTNATLGWCHIYRAIMKDTGIERIKSPTSLSRDFEGLWGYSRS